MDEKGRERGRGVDPLLDESQHDAGGTELRSALREAYADRAHARDQRGMASWKVDARGRLLSLLQTERKHSLLELGSGPGHDARFFQEHKFDVLATDLSPKMVELCRSKGLEAAVMDMADLRFEPGRFDAVYAFNSLLHLPKDELPIVLSGIREVLAPGGLFFMGVYGGRDFEGVWDEDFYRPKRFFSFYTDRALIEVVSSHFEVISFDVTETNEKGDGLHFQAAVLRN